MAGGAGGIVFPSSSWNEGEIFPSPRHFLVQPARRYIFRVDPSLNLSPFSFSRPHPPFAFASSLSVRRHLERVYFRLVSKVNTLADGLALVHLFLTTLTKVTRHGKKLGRMRIKAEPANRNVRLQAASVRQLGDDLSSCPFGS